MTSPAIQGFTNTYQESRSLGGTDAGAIIGVNRYKTIQDVWDRLHGVNTRPTEDPIWLERGRVMEPIIAAIYERDTGRQLALSDRTYHDTHPFLHATPDRDIVSGSQVLTHGPGILEIKCLGSWTFKQTKEEGIDPSYYAQLQHYLFVRGLKWGSFAVFNADLWELYIIDVMRDEPFVAHMVDACVQFWNNHVLPGVRPSDAAARSPFTPANIGAESVTITDHTITSAFHSLKSARENASIAKHQVELAEDALRDAVGDRDVKAIIPGVGKFSYQYEYRTVTDMDRLLADHPDVDLSEYQFKKQTERRVLRPTFSR